MVKQQASVAISSSATSHRCSSLSELQTIYLLLLSSPDPPGSNDKFNVDEHDDRPSFKFEWTPLEDDLLV